MLTNTPRFAKVRVAQLRSDELPAHRREPSPCSGIAEARPGLQHREARSAAMSCHRSAENARLTPQHRRCQSGHRHR
eukprot:13510313-Heterocapsa_arctica.AAC.1